MALASPSLPPAADDTDDFDWEAAVREIDTACAIASTSNRQEPPHPPPAARSFPSSSSRGRQSTLDRFVDSFSNQKKAQQRTPIAEAPRVYRRGDNPGVEGAAGVEIDMEAANTWIYPVNVPLRDYQFSIARTALFSNTLVALPTGLGKTLIAAVVMFNYFRWFPEGKIVFAAPSRPLVMQQIEACHNIVGIPQEWTIDMTGQMSPPKRSTLWKVKRVFFVTPQVLERDIQSGICAVKQLVCLVIDEAHRALGNYSYCVAVRELIAIPIHLRILALTATPGSKQLTIQNVIDNLCISTLEYRNEDDRDVSKYVHNRQLELIKVELTKEAVVINDLLLEAINPFVSRLVSMGVLYNKDSSTLSPCELLNSREKFRQAPPQNLPQANCGEVEGYFGILITLYHIRKLLSSHGIRPAFEMLDEKLRQGSFARSMSRNENIHRAKLLMQQSLSHGAPNPKLVKLMEVLIDHFKTKDPKDSRVIIFSNFRGSVKDIMDSLSNIGDLVKATEFIGQSSGKKLKGQSQKMQQAVLQKFRSGGYNVIVATSIGEEGLDIMEVDLVICFDANVSPLRMIQRMGRTGRKHDGRVVILACEGFELKGYLKKQASSKAIRKHMNNGGLKSFDFHPSPRMVPHICKPEVNFIELSIEQYIPRGRKVKEDSVHGSPFSKKISEEEGDLISKYFQASNTETWKPSLIAFPTFQAFPSRVHKVHHSFKTTAMLIDAMQHLQGLSFCNAKKSGLIKADTSNTSPEVLPVVDDINEKDSAYVHFVADDDPTLLQEKVYDCEGSLRDTVNCRDVLHTPDVPSKNLSGHHFLFGEDFVTLNTLGNVFIVSIPELPKKGSLASNVIAMNNAEGFQLNTENHAFSKVAGGENDRFAGQLKDTEEVQLSSKLMGFEDEEFSASKLPKCDTYKGHLSGTSVLQERDENADEVLGAARIKISATLANESRGTSKDMELSPRIAHFIEEGIVPESPAVEISQYSPQVDEMVYVRCTPEHDTFELQDNINDKKILTGETLISAILVDSPIKDGTGEPYQVSPNFTKFSGVSIKGNSNVHKKEMDNLQHGMHDSETLRNMSSSPANKEIHTPLEKPLNSSSEDWQLNSDEVSRSLQQAPKYKRLRKFGDMVGNLPSKSFKDKLDSSVANTCFPATRRKSNLMDPSKGKKEKRKEHLNAFVEVEADVSQDAEVSEDEEDIEIDDKYEDSFIDDRINPTEACSHPENSGVDMMAIYRRSLLTQSPGECLPNCLTTPHNSISSRTAESGSCSSDKFYRSLETPQVYSHSAIQSTNRNSVTCQWNSEKSIQIITPGETSCTSNKFESRKRKLSFLHPAAGPTISVPPEHTFSSDQASQLPLHPPENDDDDFFRGIDLDAVEAEATMILRCKPDLSQRTVPNHEGKGDESMNLCPPSFDLGF